MEPVSSCACDFFRPVALREAKTAAFEKTAKNVSLSPLPILHQSSGPSSSLKRVLEISELLSLVLSQVLLEANVSERLFKHRVKALVTVSASWRNITRKLLHDNNICFHIFYPMLYCGILRKLLNGLKNVKLLPVKIHLSGGDLHSNTVRKFLFRFSGEILELIFTSNLALQGSVDVFSKCMFPNLKTLRICVTNKDTEIACVAEDVSPLIIAVLATAHKLVNFGYHNIGDGKLCDKGFSSQIKLPKSLRKLEIFTHRLDTIKSNLTCTGLTHLNEIKVAYVSGYPTCACPREIPQSFLIHLLLCSGSSLDQALICSIDRVLPVCLTLPALQRIRSLTLRNIVLPGTTDAFNLNSEFPALKHLFITACSPTILIHLISPDSNSLKSFQFIASANKLIPHKGEICELILNRVIGGLQNCKCMIISWRSMQAMQKAMPIIFRNATNLERLQLELEVRFWTTTSTNLAMEEILTGLSREKLALAKRQCCSLYESAYKTGGIQNLTGLKKLEIYNWDTTYNCQVSEFLFVNILMEMPALQSLRLAGFAKVSCNLIERWCKKGKTYLYQP